MLLRMRGWWVAGPEWFCRPPTSKRLDEPRRFPGRQAHQLALPHHAAAAHDRADRPAGDLDAVIGRPTALRGDPSVGDGLAALQVHDGEVGVVAGRDAALVGQAEDAARPLAGEVDETRQREPP